MRSAVLIHATSALGHHGCTLVNMQLERLANEAGIAICAKLPLHFDWNALAPRQFDLVIVNGEGTLHSNSRGARRISQVPAWAKARGATAHLINTVYQDNDRAIIDGVAGFDSVYARDNESLANLLADHIPACKVADLSLTWTPPLAKGAGGIVVMGSTVDALRNDLWRLSKRLNATYLPILAHPDSGIAGGNHKHLFRYRAKRLVSYFAVPGPWRTRWRGAIPDFPAFIDYLQNNASLLITGRFHGAAMALLLEIPVLVMPSNTHKMEALFSEIGSLDRVFGNTVDVERHVRERHDFSYSPKELDAIRALRATTREDARKMMTRIHGADESPPSRDHDRHASHATG
jgi:hypothetical protein